MWQQMWQKLSAYHSSIILLLAISIGGVLGVFLPDWALMLKPLGQAFLNLLFMMIVPLVAISVVSSIASITDLRQLGKILLAVLVVSALMAMLPALIMMGFSEIYNPAQGVVLDLTEKVTTAGQGMDFVAMFTANDFSQLLSKSHILALIIMSILAGIAISQSGEQGKKIADLFDAANTVVMNMVSLIMKLAPIGLGAFFAATMAAQDPKLLSTFASAIGLYMVALGFILWLVQRYIPMWLVVLRRLNYFGRMSLNLR